VLALRIIHDEHRSMAAVLHGMLHVVHDIRDQGRPPDFRLLGAMVYYIDAFPERFHHPKEDKYLFTLLRARLPEAGPVLDRLHEEHRSGAAKIRTLDQALVRYEQGGKGEFAAFAAAVESYAAFHWEHMRCEEKEVLPQAEKHLTQGDWEAIDAAFSGHTDPLFGAKADEAYHKLFQRILNLAPPPLGVGDAPHQQSAATTALADNAAPRDDIMSANVGPTDRAVRIVVGLLLLSAILFVDGPNRWWGLLGLVPLTTAWLRWCPAYVPLGIRTTKPE